MKNQFYWHELVYFLAVIFQDLAGRMKNQFYWHVHHDILLEPLTEPVENRIAYITAQKSQREIKTRLRLLKPVAGKLPNKVLKAGADYIKASADWEKAGADYIKAGADWKKAGADSRYRYTAEAKADYDKAGEDYVKACQAAKPRIKVLHKRECLDCPWDGKTIFP